MAQNFDQKIDQWEQVLKQHYSKVIFNILRNDLTNITVSLTGKLFPFLTL